MNSEWIEWNGGECPVSDIAMVSLRFRHGGETDKAHPAYLFRWARDGGMAAKHDIIAYRVVQP